MDELFLLEILIERIEFFAYVKNVPQKKQINVFVGFGNIAQLEIRSETPGEASEGKSKRNIEYNAGKSYLFPCRTETMIDALKTCPLEISMYDKGSSEPVGSTNLPWDNDFIDMVLSSQESAGFYVTPMSLRKTLKFSSKVELVGEFILFLRLSCFGKSIQTSVQVQQAKEGGRLYLFKDSNAATTFQCQKYGMMGTSSDTIPVAPLYNLATGLKNLRAMGAMTAAAEPDGPEKESWFQLFDDATMSLMSLRPTEFKAVDIIESTFSTMSGTSQQSGVYALTGRVQENKYLDFLRQLLSKPVDEEELGVTGEGELSPNFSDKVSTSGSTKEEGSKDGEEEEEEKVEELTADRIGRLLCKSRDCPGALKFKEFGIGPLATGRGLGTVYDVTGTTPPTTYGMSQTYGVLDNYGPYGVFSRPKRPEEPFVPAKRPSNVSVGECRHKICAKHRKALEEGRIKLPPQCVDNPCQRTQKHQCKNREEPLRIKGGSACITSKAMNEVSLCDRAQENMCQEINEETLADRIDIFPNDDLPGIKLEYFNCRLSYKRIIESNICGSSISINQSWSVPLRLRGGGQITLEELSRPKSPMLECRVIMQQFDSILQEYKKALGPCGQVSCPYAPNLMEKPCLKECVQFDTQNVDLISCIDIDCPLLPQLGILPKEPPHKDDSLSNCGAFDCPFPDASGKQQPPKSKHLKNACGSVRCPYTKYKTGLVDEDAALELQFLPPAVSGKCGHPSCPYPVEMDLPPIHWDCPEPLPKGPCKNPDCPYLPPDLKCLRVLAPKGPCGSPTCPYVTPSPCGSPHCPFAPRPCPYMADPDLAPAGDYNRDSDSCGDADCPFDRARRCKNPACSFSKENKKTEKKAPCGKAQCPYAEVGNNNGNNGNGRQKCCWKGDTESECDDPDCPFAKRQPTACGNPNCPYSQAQEPAECPDAECPCGQQKTQAPPSPPPSPYPECPYAIPSPCPYEPSFCPYSLPLPCGAAVPPCQRPQPLLCEVCRAVLAAQPAANALPADVEMIEDVPTATTAAESAQEGAAEPSPPPEGDGQKTGEGGDFPVESVVVDADEAEDDLIPCRQGTCKSTGGTLVCEECPCEGVCASEGQIPDKNKKQVKKGKKTVSEPGISKRKKICLRKLVNSKKWKSKYVYSVGDKYPGIQVGHRECVMPGFNVPANMGWLWNIHTPCLSLRPRRGWRPGAVTRTIAKRIHDHRVAQGLAVQQLPDFSTGKRKKKHHGIYESDSDSTVAPKPTLLIKKEKGAYFITMNPLKDPNTLADNENPYMDCTPMQFKITKNKKPKMKNDEDLEYKTCYCGDSDDDDTPSTSTSDSELDIEFTPPAGIIRPDRLRKKKNVVHCESQYDPEDCKPPPAKGKKDKKDKGKKGKGKKGKGDKKGGKGKKKKK